MSFESGLYGSSMSLLTDLYQLTMAHGYWHRDKLDQEAVFHMFFRENPFDGGYAVAAGLEQVVGYIEGFGFDSADLDYLASLEGADAGRLFPDEFLSYLEGLSFTCDVDAVPEGTVVFPYEPLLRIRGPLVECQLLETPILNILNFQTLIATKAARVVQAAEGEPVIEFGLRRAQGPDGGVTASRAAYVGGCVGTSNVLAGKVHGIPVKGTHAHSWVMAFDSEMEAFEAYAEAMPNNCILLVDTYDTLDGVRSAIAVAESLAERGHSLVGVRLDSGDLAWLSRQARALLDEAGLEDTVIVGSNELDEHLITSLKAQDAAIGVWGVGTKLVTGHGQPALGGVYKLSAIRDRDGAWDYKVKLSEQALKVTNPGILQIRRFSTDGRASGDMVFDIENEPTGVGVIVDPADATRWKRFSEDSTTEDLLDPVFRAGERVYSLPGLDELRARTIRGLEGFDPTVKRLLNPHEYPVGLEKGLHDTKMRLIREARGYPDEEE